jgi:hypothetical protein
MAGVPECPSIEVLSRELAARLPGGATIQVTYPGDPPSALALVQQLMAQSSAALAPLAPAFSTIRTVLAVVEWAQSVPLVIANPPEFAEKTQELIDAAADMASLAPPLSVPAMVVSLLDVLIAMLEGMVTEMQGIIDYQARIADAQSVLDGLGAGGNEAIQGAITCATSHVDSMMLNFDESMSSAGGFIDLINLFMALIGLDPVPDLGKLDDDPTGSIEALGVMIDTIKVVRSAIPL